MPNDFWIQCHQISEYEKETTYQLSVRLKHICSKSNVVSQLREKVSYETLSPRQHNIWWDQPIKMGHISHFQNTILPKKISIACLLLFHSESNFRNSPSFSLKSNIKNSSYQQNKKISKTLHLSLIFHCQCLQLHQATTPTLRDTCSPFINLHP